MALEEPPITLTRHSPITIAVDPIALVITECITVTSAMRKHPWWAQSSVSAILGGGPNQQLPLDSSTRRVVAPVVEEEDGGWRWGGRRDKGKVVKDNPLIAAFTKLRADLRVCRDLKTFDTAALLHPFLQVIRSSSTSASITSLALIAVTKFLSYGVINASSPRLSPALQLLAAAITHCLFPPSQQNAADEVVFMRILKLMESLISGPCGDILSDESVCSIMEAGLNMCCDPMRTQLLQRSVEIMMVSMCQVIFERLKTLEWEIGEEGETLEEQIGEEGMGSVKMETTAATPNLNGNESTTTLAGESNSNGESAKPSMDAETSSLAERPKEPLLGTEKAPQDPNSSTLDLTAAAADPDQDEEDVQPYSLPSIKELFRSLVDLLDPNAKEYTDTHRVMALRMVNVALEVAGPSIASHPSLAFLAKDTLCRHLFQLVRSENMAVLSESLRVAVTLMATCRSVLKLQMELYLDYLVSCLYPRSDIPTDPNIDPKLYQGVPLAPSSIKPSPAQSSSASGRSTPVPVKERKQLGLEGSGLRKPDAKEAMVESLGALVRMPGFMAELFVNYDCEIDRHDLCADMVGLLARNAFPDAHVWSTTNVPPLCLDALLGFVQGIDDRLDEENSDLGGRPDVDRLRKQRDLKKVIIRGASKFNESPKSGIAFLGKEGVIPNVDDPAHIARFVRSTSLIDEKVLGEFLTKRGNEAILTAFIGMFDFSSKTVEESLREMLYTFRLPGESQLIERIVNVFSAKYLADGNHDGIAGADAVLVLVYAIIMLNTDQHNPTLKKTARMSPEQFMRNLRGTNTIDEKDPKDFEPEYLQSIFTSIKTHEIILPEEHNNQNAYDHAWKELLVKITSASDLSTCSTNAYDADMFAATWRPIVATLSYVFKSASEDAVFSRVFIGFAQCAHIAARHGITACLDQIVFSLSSISTLAPNALPSTSLNTEVAAEGPEEEGEKTQRIMVSETAVRFGRDDRAQQATVMLFRALEGNEACLRDGWEHVVKIMMNLFVNSLIPARFDGIAKVVGSQMPAIPLQPPVNVVERSSAGNEGGLFSALSSYVSSFANDEPPEPSEQEIENSLSAVDCITECHFEELIERMGKLPVDSLRSLVDTLLAQMPEDSSPRVIVVKPENMPPVSPRPDGSTAKRSKRGISANYDPTLVWALELSTLLAMRDQETVAELGKDVAVALQTTLRNVSSLHYVTTARVVYYLLSLLRVSDEHDFLRAPVLLHTFATFEEALLEQCAEPLVKGISECMRASAGVRSEMSTSPDFWDLLHKLHALPAVAPMVFAIVEEMAASSASASIITADNYEKAIALLDDFATAASVGAADERRRDAAVRERGKGAKMPKRKHAEELQRGVKALNLVQTMTTRVPAFIASSQLEPTEAWTAYWSPIFRSITKQCLNPCREMRTSAFSALRSCLLNEKLLTPKANESDEFKAVFDEILFPLVGQLLKPEVFGVDRVGMGDTRVQAAQLVCKVFLFWLQDLKAWSGFVGVWGRILGVMDRLINSGQGDTLEEAVSENIKNILLVMSSQNILVPPSLETKEQEPLWNETWKRLDRFLPHLFAEIFPEEAKKPRSAAPKRSTDSTIAPQRAGTPSQAPERGSAEAEAKPGVESSEKKAEAA